MEYFGGKVLNTDAMSEEYINNKTVKQYLDDEDCAVILFENPPYHDESSGMDKGKVERSGKRGSYVLSEMKKEVNGVATNEIANQFIWSSFKYYLRQDTDSYIVFSPIKYWKQSMRLQYRRMRLTENIFTLHRAPYCVCHGKIGKMRLQR